MKKFITLIALFGMTIISAIAGNNIKTNYRTALVMAYSPVNSIFEDENIKLEIYNEILWATNKTDKTIFIDLSQCFLIHNGSSYPIYVPHQNDNNASTTGVSTSIDNFISIAPTIGTKQNATYICRLAGMNYGKYSTAETHSDNFTEYEERLRALINELVTESLAGDPKGKNNLGTATRHLTEDESINNIGASLAYAFNKRAEDWIPIAISTWVSDVYLAPYYVEMPAELSKKEKQGFSVKKTEAAKIHVKADSPFEFEQDKSPIVVCDWSGNFKKGTFELNPTWVSKKKNMTFNKIFDILTSGNITEDIANSFYKKEIVFNGHDADWGKMSYWNFTDLSLFNNKR